MKQAVGMLMILAGIALGLYVGLWLCLIGGIVQIINAVKAPEVNALDVAFGICRIILTSFAGSISAMLLIIPGFAIVNDD